MTDETPKILVVDDEAELRNLLQRYLTDQGFGVRAVADAAHMDRLLQRERFDVLVLDIMMPGEDGLSICRRLRGTGQSIPIIMLTARGDAVDRIVGLEMGADDYLPKPFNPRELVARIQAQLRRQSMSGRGPLPDRDESYQFGPFTLHAGTRDLVRNGEAVRLTSGEFGILRALVANAGRPMGRERLIELAKGRDHDATDRSVDVTILRLRRLIEDDPADPRYIKTVWGLGYVFVLSGNAS